MQQDQQDTTQVELNSIHRSVNISLMIATIVFMVLVGGYTFWFWFLNNIPLSRDSSIWGAFGDFVGGILNPIIAFLAFYWLTRSVIIQKTELAATQSVLAETQKATEDQAITQEKKRFEDSFYSLLEQMNNVATQLKLPDENHTKKRSDLEKLYHMVFAAGLRELMNPDIGNQPAKIDIYHARMMDKCVTCNHYFRIIYHILKFIMKNHTTKTDESAIQENVPLTEQEKFYSNIVRSFLDKNTTQLLAINCISSKDSDFYKYRQLIERYAMLEHLYFEHEGMDELLNRYENSAFGTHPKLKQFNQQL